jgi:DNA-binding transcriptional LysR family regulator
MSVESRQLAVFLAVVEAGGFSRAAERLGMTQPAVSGQVQRLERQLRVRLFDRTGRSVTLTDDGHRLLPMAVRAVSAVTEVEQSMGRRNRTLLRLSAEAPSLARILTGLREIHSEFKYDITIDLSESSVREVRYGNRHCAQVYDFDAAPLDLTGLACTVLLREPVWAVLPRTHRLAAAPVVSLRDLAGDPWLLRPPGTRLRQLVVMACRAAGFEPYAPYSATDSYAIEVLVAGEGCVTLGSPINSPSTLMVQRPLAEPVMRTILLVSRPGSVPQEISTTICRQMIRSYWTAAAANNPEYHATHVPSRRADVGGAAVSTTTDE